MKLKMLRVVFDTEIAPYEVPAFRGAIIEKVGIENDWFHNHNNEDGQPISRENKKVHYRYPMVQYKRILKHPCILFLEHGIEEAKLFFNKQTWELKIGGKHHQMPIASLTINEFDLKETEEYHHYNIHNWLALNSKNVVLYDESPSLVEKIKILERVLIGNILSFCKGMSWMLENRLHVDITEWKGDRVVTYKGIKVRSFNLAFRANIKLPPHIGIGKGGSKGHGVLVVMRR